jgi:hypothetical protein
VLSSGGEYHYGVGECHYNVGEYQYVVGECHFGSREYHYVGKHHCGVGEYHCGVGEALCCQLLLNITIVLVRIYHDAIRHFFEKIRVQSKQYHDFYHRGAQGATISSNT